MGLILLIVVLMLVAGTVPAYGYSRNWGYRPVGGFGLLLVIVLVLLFMNVIPWGFGGPVHVAQPVVVQP